MKKIKNHIYFENSYSGATVGAFLFSDCTVLIDAPLKPDEGRAWLSDLKKAGAKPNRIAVNLDAHPDRTLGMQTLDAEVIAHRETGRQFRRRAAIFKALKQESGAEWEETSGLSGLRWIMPRLTFSEQTLLHYDERHLLIEARPGPGPGSCWLVAAEDKVLFVGDMVTIGQPPFLAQADIDDWQAGLQLLLSREYKDYTIICGRGGKVTTKDIKQMQAFLKDAQNRLKRLTKRNVTVEIEKMAPKLLDRFKAPTKNRTLYLQRLKYGLHDYYSRHFSPVGSSRPKN